MAPVPTKNTRRSPKRLSRNASSVMDVAATTVYPTMSQFAIDSVTPKWSATSGNAMFTMVCANDARNEHARIITIMLFFERVVSPAPAPVACCIPTAFRPRPSRTRATNPV